MPKIGLVKAIVRYRSSFAWTQKFVHGNRNKEHSTRYLLMQKAKDKFFPENIGKWEFVGGLVERGETSKQAITREVKEETGLEFRVVKQLPTLRKADKKYESTCDVYLIDVASMNVKLSPEHSDYRWMKAEDIQKQDLVLYADLLLEFFNNHQRYLD